MSPWFNWLHMTSAENGYALSGQDYLHYRLLRTTDGGHVWHDITPGGGKTRPNGPPSVHGSTLLFSRRQRHGTFVVERSDDGGRTWTASLPLRNKFGVGAGTPREIDRRHLYVDLGEGVAAGSAGEALYTSNDGGHRWHLVAQTNVNRTRPGGLPFGCDKDGFGFATPSQGWAGGFCAGGNPFFLRTTDGGRHWSRQVLPGVPRNCQCDTPPPTFFSRRVGVVSISGIGNARGTKPFARLYWTADGGNHWRASNPTSGRIGAIDVVSSQVVWLSGRFAGDAPRFPRLFRTIDAGRRWSSLHIPVTVDGDVPDAVNATLGFASSGATIWRTSDGGRHWTAIHPVIR